MVPIASYNIGTFLRVGFVPLFIFLQWESPSPLCESTAAGAGTSAAAPTTGLSAATLAADSSLSQVVIIYIKGLEQCHL
jgi:hypothetical protein